MGTYAELLISLKTDNFVTNENIWKKLPAIRADAHRSRLWVRLRRAIRLLRFAFCLIFFLYTLSLFLVIWYQSSSQFYNIVDVHYIFSVTKFVFNFKWRMIRKCISSQISLERKTIADFNWANAFAFQRLFRISHILVTIWIFLYSIVFFKIKT